MAAETPFSLEHLDPETRALAERAARAAGLTVEQWIIRAIMRKAGSLPKPLTPSARAAAPPTSPPPAAAPEPSPPPPPPQESSVSLQAPPGASAGGVTESPPPAEEPVAEVITARVDPTAAPDLSGVPPPEPAPPILELREPVRTASPVTIEGTSSPEGDEPPRRRHGAKRRLLALVAGAVAAALVLAVATAALMPVIGTSRNLSAEIKRFSAQIRHAIAEPRAITTHMPPPLEPPAASSSQAGKAPDNTAGKGAAPPPHANGADTIAKPSTTASVEAKPGNAVSSAAPSATMPPAQQAAPRAEPQAETAANHAPPPAPPFKAAPAPVATAALPPAGAGSKPTRVPPAALRELEHLAKRGDPRAQNELAELYARGDRLPQNYGEAAHWYREAALQGVAAAQFHLGELYERGLGVEKNPLESLLWYLSAAEQGHPTAQYDVGMAYADGKGIPQNNLEARKWLSKAAEQGVAAAADRLGQLDEQGLGAPADAVAAYSWYKIAVRGGAPEAEAHLDALRGKMSAEQVAEGERRFTTRAATIPAEPSFKDEPENISLLARPPVPRLHPAKVPVAGDATPQKASAHVAEPVKSAEPSPLVADIQHRLNSLGYDAGADNGIVDEKTAAAIRAFQREAGLPADGQPSPQLLQAIKTIGGQP